MKEVLTAKELSDRCKDFLGAGGDIRSKEYAAMYADFRAAKAAEKKRDRATAMTSAGTRGIAVGSKVRRNVIGSFMMTATLRGTVTASRIVRLDQESRALAQRATMSLTEAWLCDC